MADLSVLLAFVADVCYDSLEKLRGKSLNSGVTFVLRI